MADATDSTQPALTGGCGCRAVRFEVSEPLIAAAYCHCTICQHRTGTAAQGSALAAYDSVRVTEGAEHIRGWQPTDGNIKQFCEICGSALFAVSPQDDKVVFVRLGSIDGDPGIRPQVRQFVAYAAPWETIPDDGLPRFDERAGS